MDGGDLRGAAAVFLMTPSRRTLRSHEFAARGFLEPEDNMHWTACETLPATEPLGQWPWSGYRGPQVYRSSAERRDAERISSSNA